VALLTPIKRRTLRRIDGILVDAADLQSYLARGRFELDCAANGQVLRQ
jgi:hypothetical protein